MAVDSAKSFEVTAVNTLVTVAGTRFAVRYAGRQVRVLVEEGSVRMTQPAQGWRKERQEPRDQTSLNSHAICHRQELIGCM